MGLRVAVGIGVEVVGVTKVVDWMTEVVDGIADSVLV